MRGPESTPIGTGCRAALVVAIGLLAAVIFGANLMVAVQGRSATTDATLMLGTTVVLLGWVEGVVGLPDSPRYGLGRWAVWYAAGAWMLLAKGPVGPAVVVAAIAPHACWLIWKRHRCAVLERGWLRLWPHGIGVLLAGLPVALWVVAIEARTGNFLDVFVGKEVLDRAANPQEGHAGPVFYYVLVLGATLLPWWPLASL